MNKQYKILVLCGGKFALPALQQLAKENYLGGVAIGKGEKSIVKAMESETNKMDIPFREFRKASEISNMAEWIDQVQPDAVFSICFPFLLPETVLSRCNKRFINFHTGPLPEFRGPMPLFEVLRREEKETALSVHFMTPEFDDGAIILTEPLTIEPQETFGSLAVKMASRTALTALNIAEMLTFGNTIPSFAQDETEASYFDYPEAIDTFIRWDRMTAHEIEALINACNPWNTGADTLINGTHAKIITAVAENKEHNNTPGDILGEDIHGRLCIACADNEQLAVSTISCDSGILTAKQFIRKQNFNQYNNNKQPELQ